MINQEFLSLYAESVQLKDWGLLKSALQKRREATQLMKNNDAYYRLGKANEMILLGFHIGDGIQARAACLEALKDLDNNGLDAFAQLDREWQKQFGISILRDCLEFSFLWAESFQEAINYSVKLVEYFPTDRHKKRLEEVKESRMKTNNNWYDCQRGYIYNFASRDCVENDNGKYAPAMSMLQCIMQNINLGKSGYVFDDPDKAYLSYEDCLDDCLMFSIKHLSVIAQKYSTEFSKNERQMQGYNPVQEQHIIFENPLQYWLEFMPDCLPKDMEKYRQFYAMYLSAPFQIYPDLMQKLGKYFQGVEVKKTTCPRCGRNYISGTQICAYCDKPPVENSTNKPNLTAPRGCVIFQLIINAGFASYFWYLVGTGDHVWYKVLGAVVFTLFTILTLSGWLFNRKQKR